MVLLGFYPLKEFRAVDCVTAHWLQSCSDTAHFGSPRLYTSHHLSPSIPCTQRPSLALQATFPSGSLVGRHAAITRAGKLVGLELWSMVLITHWEKQKPNQPQFDHYGNIWLSFYISFSSFWFFLRESLHSFSNLFQFHNVSWSVHSFLLSLSVSFRPHSLYVC